MAKPLKQLSKHDYTVGWICALPLELAASSGMLDEEHQSLGLAQGDKNMYTLGEIGGHNIVMACLPAGNMGITPAATVASNMLRSFPNIRFGLMVGIGGGAPAPRRALSSNDIRLGDVVVSIPQGRLGGVIKYDRGKVVAGGEFEVEGFLNQPPMPVMNAVAKLRGLHELKRNAIERNVAAMVDKVMSLGDANPEFEEQYQCQDLKYDQLYEADYEHNAAESDDDLVDNDQLPLPCRHCDPSRLVNRKPRRNNDPVIHYGTIASADRVMRHGMTRERIRKDFNVLCFEMEAAGLMNDFPCLVVRGICDYADTHKHKIWQRYAAATAAAYTKELLQVVLKEDVEEAAHAKEVMESLHQKLDFLLKDKHQQDRNDILRWLDTHETHANRLAMSYASWQPDTAQDLINSEKYSKWANKHIQTLWCHGIAGSGKTVFASVVVNLLKGAYEGLRPEARPGVAYLFCEYQRQNEQDVGSLLSAILKQLVDQCVVMPQSVTELFNRHRAGNVPVRPEELSSVLNEVFGIFSGVFLVIDALDECFERNQKDLLSYVLEAKKKRQIQVLTTSRTSLDFKKVFGDCHELEIKASPKDVKRVVEVLIERSDGLLKNDRLLRREVTEGIVKAVDGMFLLVQTFLESITRHRSPGDVRDALRTLLESPEKLSTVYGGLLERLSLQEPTDRDLAHQILCWVVEAKRPLARQELQYALALKTNRSVVQNEESHSDYVIKDFDGAISLCAGLVVTSQESNNVELMHRTTRQYFEAHKHALGWMSGAQKMIAGACLIHLSFLAFRQGVCSNDRALEVRLNRYPFLEYAARHWGNHVHDTHDSVPEMEDLALSFLLDDAKVASSNQVAHLTHHRLPGYSQHFVRRVDGLQTAALFGLTSTVRRLIQHGVDTQSTDEHGRTALHRASKNGHGNVVRTLLAHGADVNAIEFKNGRTPLHLATLNGHNDMLQMILDHGAEASAQDDDGWTAIHMAAWTGNEGAVRVLLGSVDVNLTGKDQLTALHCAAAQGHETVARLLVSEGAAVDAEDVDGWTPLHWVSKKRHNLTKPRALTIKTESSVLLDLLSSYQKELKDVLPQGVLGLRDQMAFAKEQVTSLQSKVASLPFGVETALDSRDEDILATIFLSSTVRLTGFLGTFLPEGMTRGERQPLGPEPPELVFAIQDELTAWHCSVQCSHVQVADLLLKNGASIDKKSKAAVHVRFMNMTTWPTALHLAAYSDHTAMVRLLLKKGASIHSKSDSGAERDDQSTTLCVAWNALHWAVALGNHETVQLLLDNEADVETTFLFQFASNSVELTPLQLAVALGHKVVTELLVLNRANLHARGKARLKAATTRLSDDDNEKETAFSVHMDPAVLHLAVASGNRDIMEVLLQHLDEVNSNLHVGIDSWSLQLPMLHLAILRKDKQMAQVLLEKGADGKAKLLASQDGGMHAEMPLLHLAVSLRDEDLSRLLITAGADVNALCQIDFSTKGPLNQEAKQQPHQRRQREEGEGFGETFRRILGRTAELFTAFLSEEMADLPIVGTAVQFYQEHQDDVYTFHAELTPLHLAVMAADDAVLHALLETINCADHKLRLRVNDISLELTALHLAILRGRENLIQPLLNIRVDTDPKPLLKAGSWMLVEATLLQLATLSRNAGVVQLLLSNGSDVRETSHINNTVANRLSALHLAALFSSEEVFQLLIQSGADISESCRVRLAPRLEVEFTTLHLVAISGKLDIVQQLLEAQFHTHERAMIRSFDMQAEFTVLHLAVMWRHEQVVVLLLKESHDVDTRCQVDAGTYIRAELTALHLAILSGNRTIVKMLLQADVDTQLRALVHGIPGCVELTVLHLAAMARHDYIVEMLLDIGVETCELSELKIQDVQAKLSLMHLAALRKDCTMLQLLLTKGYNADSKFQFRYEDACIELTPLHLAATFSRNKTAQVLLDHGADADASSRLGIDHFEADFTSLHLATIKGNRPMMHQLLYRSSCGTCGTSCRSHSPSMSGSIGPFRTGEQMQDESGKNSSRHFEQSQTAHGVTESLAEHTNEPPLSNHSPVIPSIHPITSRADVNKPFLLKIGSKSIRFTAIHIAALLLHRETLSLLLRAGCDINELFELDSADTHAKLTALHIVVLTAPEDLVEACLESNLDVETKLRSGVKGVYVELSALHIAAIRGSKRLTQLLLESGFDPEETGAIGARTKIKAELRALHLLALLSDKDMATLLDKGVGMDATCTATIEVCTHFEVTALDIAVSRNSLDVADVLAASGSESGSEDQVDNATDVWVSLLILLFASGRLGKMLGEVTLKALLIFDQEALLTSAFSRTPHLAALADSLWAKIPLDDLDKSRNVKFQAQVEAAFEPLTQADSTFHINIEAELTALHVAAGLGDATIVRLLIDRGVDVEEKCQLYVGDSLHAELSALHLAVMGQHDKVVQLLLGKGADVYAAGTVTASRTVHTDLVAPCAASIFGLSLGLVQRSLGRNGEIDLEIESHPTAMHFAALTNGDVVARSLLNHGAEVDADCDIYIEAVTEDSTKVDIEGSLTALHLAACTGQDKMTQLLLATRANVNSHAQARAFMALSRRISLQMNARCTALHLAAGLGHEEVVRLLIGSGADLRAKTADGRTARQLAKKYGHDGTGKVINENLKTDESIFRRWFGGRA